MEAEEGVESEHDSDEDDSDAEEDDEEALWMMRQRMNWMKETVKKDEPESEEWEAGIKKETSTFDPSNMTPAAQWMLLAEQSKGAQVWVAVPDPAVWPQSNSDLPDPSSGVHVDP